MTQGERVNAIRKSKEVNLTLEKFGQRIGVGKSTISDIENGRRNLTEQMTKSICREFGVDYVWFTTGDGEMFVETDDDFMETIDRIMIGENEFHKNLFKALAHLDENELFALEHILDKVINFTKGDIDE